MACLQSADARLAATIIAQIYLEYKWRYKRNYQTFTNDTDRNYTGLINSLSDVLKNTPLNPAQLKWMQDSIGVCQ